METEQVDSLPTLLDILDKISEAEESFRNNKRWGILSNLGMEDKFEIVPISPKGTCILRPTFYSYNKYFRGQTAFYQNCTPSIFRKDEDNKRDSIDIFIDRLRSCEFELLLKTHPVVKKLNKGIRIDKLGLDLSIKVDYKGLAQHYELNTNMIDFTNNKWVAAFFAACKKKDDKYIPIDPKEDDNEEIGVFYTYSQPPDQLGGKLNNTRLSVIG